MILVGGVVTTGERGAEGQRAELQKEKVKKVRECLESVKERTPETVEKSEFMIGTYAITKMTWVWS